MTRLSAIPMAALMGVVCWGTLVMLGAVLVVLVTGVLARALVGWMGLVLR